MLTKAVLKGDNVLLRSITLADCVPAYLSWLQDPEVNQYLETRWQQQDMESIRQYVANMRASADNYLFAIVERNTDRHIGNIKLGSLRAHHLCAAVSYFIGDKLCWGQGYASEAIRLASDFALQNLGLHRVQAGIYKSNMGSRRALEKAGFVYEARFVGQLRGPAGWEDHEWYVKVNDDRL